MRRTFIILSLISLLSTGASAKSESGPRFFSGCNEVGHEFDNGQLALKPVFKTEENQVVFLLHNFSENDVTIKLSPTKITTIYPSWERILEVDRWAAFATDKENLSFSCFTKDGAENSIEINCQEALEVCQYENSKFGPQNRGNYWISENLSKIETRDRVIKSGILLR